MNREIISNPSLVEPGVKYFLGETLRNCKSVKNKYYNFLFNLSIFVLFFVTIGGFLYYKYLNHNNSEERENNKKQTEEYMLNIVHKIQTENRYKNGSKITDLPEYQNEFEDTIRKF